MIILVLSLVYLINGVAFVLHIDSILHNRNIDSAGIARYKRIKPLSLWATLSLIFGWLPVGVILYYFRFFDDAAGFQWVEKWFIRREE